MLHTRKSLEINPTEIPEKQFDLGPSGFDIDQTQEMDKQGIAQLPTFHFNKLRFRISLGKYLRDSDIFLVLTSIIYSTIIQLLIVIILIELTVQKTDSICDENTERRKYAATYFYIILLRFFFLFNIKKILLHYIHKSRFG